MRAGHREAIRKGLGSHAEEQPGIVLRRVRAGVRHSGRVGGRTAGDTRYAASRRGRDQALGDRDELAAYRDGAVVRAPPAGWDEHTGR